MDTHELIEAWHDALNDGDLDRLLELSAEDIVVGGPRSAGGRGHAVLTEWFDRVGLSLVPVAIHGDGDAVVVEQDATWPDADPDAATRVASVIEVAGGKVARVHRFGSRDEAEEHLDDR